MLIYLYNKGGKVGARYDVYAEENCSFSYFAFRCFSGSDGKMVAEPVGVRAGAAHAVYFRLRSLYAVLPGVVTVFDFAGGRVWMLSAHHSRNGHCGSRGMVQRLDCRTVMSKFPARCPYLCFDFLSFAI